MQKLILAACALVLVGCTTLKVVNGAPDYNSVDQDLLLQSLTESLMDLGLEKLLTGYRTVTLDVTSGVGLEPNQPNSLYLGQQASQGAKPGVEGSVRGTLAVVLAEKGQIQIVAAPAQAQARLLIHVAVHGIEENSTSIFGFLETRHRFARTKIFASATDAAGRVLFTKAASGSSETKL